MWFLAPHSALTHYPIAWLVVGLIVGFMFGFILGMVLTAGRNHGI